MKLSSKVRKSANRALEALPTYHKSPGLAYAAALEALAPFGLWGELEFIPKTGVTRIVVKTGTPDTPGVREVENSLLIVATHEMAETGRVEAVCYLS